MPIVSIGSLPLYNNSTDGVTLIMRDANNVDTYRVTREQLIAGGTSGVVSFNTRTGIVTLLASDISGLGIGIVSSSAFSSPSQGTLRATVNGVQTDVDLGLQTGDSVSFNTVTATLNGNASTATTASHALTASSADNFFVRQNVTGSNALFTGNITAQTLVVQTVTSSIVYSSGSNIFGNKTSDVQQMTGSLRVTGSGDHYIVGGNVGIGTASPAYELDVNGGFAFRAAGYVYDTILYAYKSSTGKYLGFTTDANGGLITMTDSTPLVMQTNGGNVLIGTTTNGTYKLDVNGTGRFSGALTANTLTTTTMSGFALNIQGTDTLNSNFGITWTTPTYTGGLAAIRVARRGATDASDMMFFTSPNGDVPNERMRLDSSGNLGLGVTPSAWETGRKALQIGAAAAIDCYNPTQAILSANRYFDGTNDKRINLGEATAYQQLTGQHIWYTAGSSTAGSNITFTQAMTLDSSGRLGIGTTSPGVSLQVHGNGTANTYRGVIRIINTDSQQWGGLAFPDGVATDSAANNYYFIGRGNALANRNLSFHIPVASDYGDSTQPKFLFASTGADTLMTLEASTGNTYIKGNVGIGTATPGLKLHVNGGAIFGPNSNSGVYISPTNENTINSGYGTDDDTRDIWLNYRGYQDGFTRFRDVRVGNGKGSVIAFFQGSTSNVGIGSTSPGYKLDVSGVASATSLLSGQEGLNVGGYGFLSQTLSGAMTILGHNLRASNSVNNRVTVVNGSWYSSMIKMYYSEGITFHTSTTAYSAGATYYDFSSGPTNEVMRITYDGKVGIGTTSPSAQLHIYKAGSTTGITTGLKVNHECNADDYVVYFTGNEAVASNSMVMMQTGNIGIGVTNPSYKLHLSGSNNTTPFGISIGQYATYLFTANSTSGYTTTFNINDTGLYIGHNSSARSLNLQTNSTDRITILGGGDVGIGTANPTAKLTVNGSILANNPNDGATGEGVIAGTSLKIDASGTGQSAKLYVVSKVLSDTYASALVAQWANQADDKGFGFNLTTGGAYEVYTKNVSWVLGAYITQGGTSWTNASDASLKTVIGPYEGVLGKFLNLNPVRYSWKHDKTNKECIGLIAQEVHKLFPEVVDDTREKWGIRYTEFVPILIKAIQEQQAQIESLKAEIAALKNP